MDKSKNIPKHHLWIEEVMDEHTAFKFRVSQTHFTGQSEFQSVDVVETVHYGKMLLNDGLVMLTEKDEFCYHDMIAHVPLFTHPNPKKVLVIGGGDGGTAREVLRHQQVEKCVMVEIDAMVVEACQKHIPQTAAVLTDDPRLELKIADGVEYVKNAQEKFDVVLVDSTDPIGPATPLFNVDFYQNVFNLLSEDGIVVAQGESPFYFWETQTALLKILEQVFPLRGAYNFSNLAYPGGLWTFVMGSKKHHPVKDFDKNRVKASGLEFQYYNSQLHGASFALPNFQLNRIGQYANINLSE
jgi:spermidine synthase